jgi:HEAT repeat protein
VFNVFMDVLFNDTNAYVRACIVKCLGDIDWPLEEIVPALLQAMHDSDDHVRYRAVESLGKITPIIPAVMDAFVSALLNDTSFGVRWEVVKNLLRLEILPEIALTAVLQASTDQHSAVRWDCALLLGQGSASDERTLQLLLHGLSDTDRNVRAACSQALVQLGQRFPEYVETIAEGLTQIIQEADNTASHFAEYGSTYDGAYNALWLLEVQNTFEAI